MRPAGPSRVALIHQWRARRGLALVGRRRQARWRRRTPGDPRPERPHRWGWQRCILHCRRLCRGRPRPGVVPRLSGPCSARDPGGGGAGGRGRRVSQVGGGALGRRAPCGGIGRGKQTSLTCVVVRVVLNFDLIALSLLGTGRPEPAGRREDTGGADHGRPT